MVDKKGTQLNWQGGEGDLTRGRSVSHNSCREEKHETATHSLLMISTPESGIRSFQLKAAQEAVLIYRLRYVPATC